MKQIHSQPDTPSAPSWRYSAPSGYTDADVTDAILKSTKFITRIFHGYAYFSTEDLQQEGACFALEAIAKGKFDASRPLANYLFCHIRNRLINLRRDKFCRNDAPCMSCHDSLPHHTSHPDGEYCEAYQKWLDRKIRKQNVLRATPLETMESEEEEKVLSREYDCGTDRADLFRLIDQSLPVELRADYLKLREGVALPKASRDAVVTAVSGIIWEDFTK